MGVLGARPYPRGGRGAWVVTGLVSGARVVASEALAWDLIARVEQQAEVEVERAALEAPVVVRVPDVEQPPVLPDVSGRGRPAVGPLVQARMPVELIERLRGEAGARGVTVSCLMRELCDVGLRR